jgi:hypothetical protein
MIRVVKFMECLARRAAGPPGTGQSEKIGGPISGTANGQATIKAADPGCITAKYLRVAWVVSSLGRFGTGARIELLVAIF